jgi:hypothetical protein
MKMINKSKHKDRQKNINETLDKILYKKSLTLLLGF